MASASAPGALPQLRSDAASGLNPAPEANAANSRKALIALNGMRAAAWSVAVLLGLAQTWHVRHDIFSDGISYLEIAQFYLRGDWNNALNSYWSPLYSWCVAGALLLLRPSLYWQASMLHVVNFAAYLGTFAAGEWLLREFVHWQDWRKPEGCEPISGWAFYLVGYCSLLFAGLSLVSIYYCSPDMMAMALTLLLAAILLRMRRARTTVWLCIALGVASGLLFLARTAFLPTFIVCLTVVALVSWIRRQSVAKPVLTTTACFLVTAGPFVAAISHRAGRFTIGDSGSLNYGWEVDGAARYSGWEGEPGDIGVPRHPITQITPGLHAFTFPRPVPGMYPPWSDPSYWYAGLKPKVKIKPQLRVLLVNASVAANLAVRSGIVICLLFLIPWQGPRNWWNNFSRYWPVLVPNAATLALYCLVYVEKRYIAGSLVVFWLCGLAAVLLRPSAWQRRAALAVVGICAVYTLAFVIRREAKPVQITVHDLIHREERYQNAQFRLAQAMTKAGVRPGDKIAYIGPGVHADWVRLLGAQIVADIPPIYERNQRLLNNLLRDNASDIRRFFTMDQAERQKILNAFRAAGVRWVVTDGSYERPYVRQWPRALPVAPDHLLPDDPDVPTQLDTRYRRLAGNSTGAFLQ